MNAIINSSSYIKEGKRVKRITMTGKPSSQKKCYFVYADINDLLNRFPIATFNQFGERVICGRRIC